MYVRILHTHTQKQLEAKLAVKAAVEAKDFNKIWGDMVREVLLHVTSLWAHIRMYVRILHTHTHTQRRLEDDLAAKAAADAKAQKEADAKSKEEAAKAAADEATKKAAADANAQKEDDGAGAAVEAQYYNKIWTNRVRQVLLHVTSLWAHIRMYVRI
jgi:hypothetical protein